MDEDSNTTTEGAAEASPTEVGAPANRRVSPLRAVRWGRWLNGAGWTVVLVVVLGLAWLSQTRAGQQLVVDRMLGLVRGSLAGELAVDEVRSRTLVTGVTLSGVRLDAAGGRRFLTADSVVIRYSPLGLILGTPRLRSTTVHGLDVEISRYPGDDLLNVSRVLAERPPAPDSARRGSPLTIGLGRISIRGGLVEVLTPLEESSAPHPVAATDAALRRIAFDIGDLDLEETMLRPGGAVVVDARLASLTTSIWILERPLAIREAFGRLSFGARGLEVSDAAIRLPGTLASGYLRYGPDRPGAAWSLSADLTTDGWGDLEDIRWVDSRIPAGSFRGAVTILAADGLDLRLRDAEAQLEASHLAASGQVRFGERITMRDLRVTANPLAASRLEPWIGTQLPLDGFLSGQVVFGGTARALQATGRMTLVPLGLGGAPTTADFSGTVHAGTDPGATGLEVRLDPLNYRIIEALWPDAGVVGGGSARLQINGRAETGIQVTADVGWTPDATSASRWVGRGAFRRDSTGVWATELSGDLAPLSLAHLGRVWPALELGGAVSGPIRAAGPLADLRIGGELSLGEGSVSIDATISARGGGGSEYRLEADADALPLSLVSDRFPDPSVLTGRISLEGSGFVLDSLEGSGSITLQPSRAGAARFDSATAVVRASAGVLTADTLAVHVSGLHVSGAGSIGMTPNAYGEASLRFATPSLLGLRPIFMGDSILVRDELNPLEQDLLRVRGIDPDTLPSALDVRMEGSVAGTTEVRGHLGDFELDLLFEMADAAYGHDEVGSATVSLSASGLPATFGDWVVDAGASGVAWAGRQFERVEFGGTMSERRGEGTLDVQRRRNERYFLNGAFAIDSVGGYADLTDASIQLNDLSWALSGPTRIAWSQSSLSVDSLDLRRLGEDPMHLVASGTLTRGGSSDFRLDVEGFHVEHALQIAQREDVDIAGHIGLDLTVVGPAERPVIDAVFEVSEPRVGSVGLSRLDGSLQYEERSSQLRIDGWSAGRNVLSASGVLPFDLALTDVGERVSDAPMDISVTADSLAAATALGYLSALQDVRGTLSADFTITGSSRDPQPRGTVRLTEGAWTLEALGVRHTGVAGEVLLRPDRTLTVKLSATRNGTAAVTGFVTLDELSDPELDLVVTFDRFLAVARSDMESTISGEFTLGGTYRLPVAEGTLRVDAGTLFVDEFTRASGVVDLTDPMLYADGFAVDTTVFVSQPVLAGLQNPFLDNLRVDIDMSVPRDVWLRSDDMNVEMGGDLLVRYDRGQGDLVLIGELEALRGSYVVLGRTFQVQGGTVAFVGQPGINPSLDIQAASRIRRREADPLEVQATVGGTLIQPLVTLSSEEAGLAQSDLISYLVFGRPSGELGTASGAGSGGLTFATGAIANQLGAAVAQEVGLDYLAVSQGAGLGGGDLQSDPASLVRSALVEAGWYLNDDVFVILVIGSRANATGAGEERGQVGLRGVRLEWALSDRWFVEGFAEDRFLRSGTGGLGTSGLDEGEVIWGAFVFREWGYGSQQE